MYHIINSFVTNYQRVSCYTNKAPRNGNTESEWCFFVGIVVQDDLIIAEAMKIQPKIMVDQVAKVPSELEP